MRVYICVCVCVRAHAADAHMFAHVSCVYLQMTCIQVHRDRCAQGVHKHAYLKAQQTHFETARTWLLYRTKTKNVRARQYYMHSTINPQPQNGDF